MPRLVGSLLNVSKFVESMFNHEDQLLYIGIVDRQYRVLAHEIRKDAKVHYTSEGIRSFVRMVPTTIVETLETLQPFLGPMSSVVIRFQKRVLAYCRHEDLVIVLGFDASAPTVFANRIAWVTKEFARAASEQATEKLELMEPA